ncbi:MAG: hypothetical protein DMG89_12580 [Acidobacteria bacterium]|nr:MAG: hypothetical protein DMG89_12580 [Acidobacteriota bacterium]
MNSSRATCVRFVSRLLLVCALAPEMMAQANVQGRWRTLIQLMPINPVHVALLHNGKVLVVAGSGNCAPGQTVPSGQPACPTGAPYGPSNNSGAGLFDPATNSFTPFPLSWDMFCNGMVVLPDGRAFINGGTLRYDPFYGEKRSAVFDPSTNLFSDVQTMAHGRWYPTVTTLGDGRAMTFSGLTETGATSTTVEIYTPGAGWSQEFGAGWTPPLYPRMHLLPNGKVFYSGSGVTSRLFDPVAHTWSTVANTVLGTTRTYGTSVLLPLTPETNYRPRVMIMGGGNPATATTEIIDLGAPSPSWQSGPDMSGGRIEMDAVILPNGKVLALGGSSSDENESTATFTADLFAADGGSKSPASANSVPRVYHSVALLLPDATVWSAGGNYTRGSYQHQMEIYEPAYLFSGVDTSGNPIPAARPMISTAPAIINYGTGFSVGTPNASDISSVVLVRPGASTHAFDMDQRLVGLSFTAAGDVLNVNSPPNSNIAPPGYYMLFVLNSVGTPSIASFVQVTQPPDFSVSATPSSRTIVQGSSTTYSATVTALNGFNGNVSLSASGLPSGANASFNPSTISGSGSSTLTITTLSSTPAGSYPITITATSGTLAHATTVTLVVTGPSDFTLVVSPTSRTINRGSSTTYSVNIGAVGSFSGTVSLTVSGLPKKTTSNFTPASITSAGTSILKVSANPTAVSGTYTLTIRGTSGATSHSTTATLTIQ